MFSRPHHWSVCVCEINRAGCVSFQWGSLVLDLAFYFLCFILVQSCQLPARPRVHVASVFDKYIHMCMFMHQKMAV